MRRLMWGGGGGGMWCQLWPLLAGLSFCVLVLLMTLREPSPPRHSKAAAAFPVQRTWEELKTNTKDLNYGIVIDAGSSGSRAFVYIWPPHSGDPHDLLHIEPLTDEAGYPVIRKISPGLSSQAPSPDNATTYLAPLLDFALEKIPTEKHKETSLFVLATAGLRLIPEKEREAILDNLRKDLPRRYPFIVMDQHIQMISGKWEGIYSWVAVNYALGKLSRSPNGTSTSPQTVGMIDMGGGSVQIAYEIREKLPAELAHLGASVNLGCQEHDAKHEFRLYVTTFLGYGANSAMRRWEDALWRDADQAAKAPGAPAMGASTGFRGRMAPKETGQVTSAALRRRRRGSRDSEVHQELSEAPVHEPQLSEEPKSFTGASKLPLHPRSRRNPLPVPPSEELGNQSSPAVVPVGAPMASPAFPSDGVADPCLPLNLQATLAPPEGVEGGRTLSRRGTGEYHKCLLGLEGLLGKRQECELDPCSMQGRHQPPIDFARDNFYGFSEYWYSSNDLAAMGARWDVGELTKRQSEYCGTKWSVTKDRWHRKLYPKADAARLRNQCFKGAWISTVLHKGFGFPESSPRFKPVQTIRGQEIQWTLGAILYKLRYFPLREIQRLRDMEKFEHAHEGERTSILPASPTLQLLLLIGAVVTVLGGIRYCLLLHRATPHVDAVGLLPRSASALISSTSKWPLWQKERLMRRSSSAADLLIDPRPRIDRMDYVY